MPNVINPMIAVELGGQKRFLRFDFNALAALEERTGMNVLNDAVWRDINARNLRAFVWAALLHEDPTLTEDQVGSWMTIATMGELVTVIQKAFQSSFPDPAEPLGNDLAPTVSQTRG